MTHKYRYATVAYMFYFIGSGIEMIGTSPTTEIFSGWDVFRGIIMIALLLVLGYCAGIESSKDEVIHD